MISFVLAACGEPGEQRRGGRQGVANLRRQEVAGSRRQGGTRNRGRVSLHAFLHHEKPPPCLAPRRLVALRRLVVGLHRDGSYFGAGDGARTRDSLLGRQGVAETPLARYRSAI